MEPLINAANQVLSIYTAPAIKMDIDLRMTNGVGTDPTLLPYVRLLQACGMLTYFHARREKFAQSKRDALNEALLGMDAESRLKSFANKVADVNDVSTLLRELVDHQKLFDEIWKCLRVLASKPT